MATSRAERILILAVFGLGLLLARPAAANVGVPLLTVTWPGAWVLLVPVVVVEALVARWVLRLPWGRSALLAGAANLVSTAIAVPLSWLLPFLPFFLAGSLAHELWPALTRFFVKLLYPFWLPPMADSQRWLIPLCAAFLCVPAFFASVWIERWVADRLLRETAAELRGRWAWRANIVSYAAIVIGLLVVAAAMRPR